MPVLIRPQVIEMTAVVSFSVLAAVISSSTFGFTPPSLQMTLQVLQCLFTRAYELFYLRSMTASEVSHLEQIALCFKFVRTLQWPKKWFVKSCFRRLVFSVTVSVWIYLLKWCQEKLCGIIHHVNRNNLYDSVLMQLTDTGGSQRHVGTPDTGWGD